MALGEVLNLCPACGEPLDDFAPCACALGHVRVAPRKNAMVGGMRTMVERKLKKRAALSAAAPITTVTKGTP